MNKPVTLKSVAAHAGVSYQTVSKVLNGQLQVSSDTRQRILDAVQELGYRPNQLARNMRIQRSFMIGYSWVQSSPNQVNQVLDLFLTSMVREAETAGYHLLPFPYQEGHRQVEAYRELIDTGRVDGFVLSSVNYNDPRIQFLLERGFPFVAFGRSNPELSFPYVEVDGASGLHEAVQHLIQRGHKRIGAICWPEDSRVGNERMVGYFEALRNAGIPAETDWIQRGEGTYEFGRTALERMLRLPEVNRPTAVITLNDTMAIGAMESARDHGMVIGRDISIIGFDDAPMSQYLFPPLTTVRQPIREAGRKCVELLVNLIEGQQPESLQVMLMPSLIVRASG